LVSFLPNISPRLRPFFGPHTLFCLIYLIFGFSQYGFSQDVISKKKIPKFIYPEGYILSKQGDTTHGFIRRSNEFEDQQRIIFYDVHGARTVYHPGIIQGYGYADQHFVSRPTPYFFSDLLSDTLIFMNRLIEGPAKLFRFYTRRSVFTLKQGPAFFDYLEKPNQEVYEVSYAFKWKRLASAFKDHPHLSEDILQGTYKPEDTEVIIKYYNSWYLRKKEDTSITQKKE